MLMQSIEVNSGVLHFKVFCWEKKGKESFINAQLTQANAAPRSMVPLWCQLESQQSPDEAESTSAPHCAGWVHPVSGELRKYPPLPQSLLCIQILQLLLEIGWQECTVCPGSGVKGGTMTVVWGCPLCGGMFLALFTWFGVYLSCTSRVPIVELVLQLWKGCWAQYLWRVLWSKC